MSRQRCTLVLIAFLALAGAWYATPTGSPLIAAQAVKPAEKEEPPPFARAFELAALLEKTIDYAGVEGKEIKLGEELERIQKLYKVTFDVNEKAFAAELMADALEVKIADPNPIPPMKTTLRTALRRILSRVAPKSRATLLIRKDHLEITTENAVRAEFGMPPAKGEERLPPLVTCEVNKLPLEAALARVALLADVNIVLDGRASKQGETTTSARLLNVPVDTAVRLLADMAGLEVVRMHNVFYVTTPANATKVRKEKDGAEPCRKRGVHLFSILGR